MGFKENKEKFIQSWGAFGTDWGINRTMAQIHALLLIAHKPLSADEIMEELQISRGNANMNIRALIQWGLVYKVVKAGERKEFFEAEKDIWDVVKKITLQRKRKELEPMVRLLEDLQKEPVKELSPEEESFNSIVNEIGEFSIKADKALNKLSNADSKWFNSIFMKLFLK